MRRLGDTLTFITPKDFKKNYEKKKQHGNQSFCFEDRAKLMFPGRSNHLITADQIDHVFTSADQRDNTG
jgi:hypothetical protein